MTINKQNHFINYIKAFCILLIIFTHYNFGSKARDIFIFPFIVNMAVPILILLSGFNFSNSSFKNGINNIINRYNLKTIFKRFIRLAIPMVVIFVAEIYLVFGGAKLPGYFFWIGGAGPGNYYFPVMLQVIILFPVLYKIISKYKRKALVGIFFANLLFEICSVLMGAELYRLLCFRYLFIFSVGSYYAINRDKIRKSCLTVSIIIGAFYIYLFKYYISKYNGGAFNLEVFNSFGGTSLFTLFYVFPIFYFVYNKFKDAIIPVKCLDKSVNYIGMASWHIFVVQMLYYITVERLGLLNSLPSFMHLSLNLIFCVSIGVVFYTVEKLFTETFLKIAGNLINIIIKKIAREQS